MSIDEILRAACELKASDVHLQSENHPCVMVDGELRALSEFPRLTPEDTALIACGMTSELQKQRLEQESEIDLAYGVPGLGRFRVNVFRQRGTVSLSLRVIPHEARPLEALNLPKVVEKICEEQRGLVLVTGTTGAGKTTTLASMIDRINSTRSDRIITIEDPLEFLHPDKKGFVVQREVGVDTPSFGSALRAALRQDPDVILVGEMRDLHTIETALLAAETGHLVFSTLHTVDAAETVHRIITNFQPRHQKQVRAQLASTLKAIISQRLVRTSDGAGRVPTTEVLIASEYIRDCIVDSDKTRLIPEAIAAGFSQYGMQTFDQSLYDLHSQGLISLDEALLHASKPDDFRLRVAGIRSTADVTRDEVERSVARRSLR